ncbi:hypothetical protein SpCBS45565_g04785 [Spizellomyces sp. 'palustris']|nr:hypothetical protein SpCBS45565_g04785 [Spizellomyces sp. 'palustris']
MRLAFMLSAVSGGPFRYIRDKQNIIFPKAGGKAIATHAQVMITHVDPKHQNLEDSPSIQTHGYGRSAHCRTGGAATQRGVSADMDRKQGLVREIVVNPDGSLGESVLVPKPLGIHEADLRVDARHIPADSATLNSVQSVGRPRQPSRSPHTTPETSNGAHIPDNGRRWQDRSLNGQILQARLKPSPGSIVTAKSQASPFLDSDSDVSPMSVVPPMSESDVSSGTSDRIPSAGALEYAIPRTVSYTPLGTSTDGSGGDALSKPGDERLTDSTASMASDRDFGHSKRSRRGVSSSLPHSEHARGASRRLRNMSDPASPPLPGFQSKREKSGNIITLRHQEESTVSSGSEEHPAPAAAPSTSASRPSGNQKPNKPKEPPTTPAATDIRDDSPGDAESTSTKRPKSSKKSKTNSSKTETGPTKWNGVYVPAGLANPFVKRPVSGGREDMELSGDVDIIRFGRVVNESLLPEGVHQSSEMTRRDSLPNGTGPPSDTSTVRSVKDAGGSSPPRHSSRLGVGEKDSDELKTQHNDDHCSACLGRGRLLCCDSCPRAFHFHCVEEGFESVEDVPEESWECRTCRAKKRRVALGMSKKGKKPRQSLPPFSVTHTTKTGIFDPLLQALDGMNPRVFELPREITTSFENVFAHPITGAYVDTREIEVARHSKSLKPSRKGIVTGAGTAVGEGPIETRRPGELHCCFKCGKTGLKIIQTSFLSSHSVPQPRSCIGRPQAVRTELVKCDYCPLYWHLDCLDPPLTSIPPELKEDEKEVVDVGTWNQLRIRTWGPSAALEMDGLEKSKSSKPRAESIGNTQNGEEDGTSGSKKSTQASGRAEAGMIQLKKKWMCPCHVDWSLPKLRINSGWKWVDVTVDKPEEKAETKAVTPSKRSAEGYTEGKGHADSSGTAKKVRTGSASLGGKDMEDGHSKSKSTPVVKKEMTQPDPHPTVITSVSRNNGYIEVINDPTTNDHYSRFSPFKTKRQQKRKEPDEEELEFGGVKYRLPERRIKLDFIDRVHNLKDLRTGDRVQSEKKVVRRKVNGEWEFDSEWLEGKFGAVGRSFRSRIGELYNSQSVEGTFGGSMLGYAAVIAEPGVAEKYAGEMRATDEEAQEWLQSVSMMQTELAHLLNMRRAANTFQALTTSMIDPSPTVNGMNTKNPSSPINELQSQPKSDCTQQNEEETILLRKGDPDWVAFCKWREEKRA